MDPDLIIKLVVLIILLILSALCSSAETALTAVSPLRVRHLLEEDPQDKRAKALLAISEEPTKMLSTILVANNVVNLSASAITASIAYQFGGRHVGLATGIITLLILIFGEIAPKTTATLRAEKMALSYARPLTVVMIILTPLVWCINTLAKGLLRLLGVKTDASQKLLKPGELETIVEVGHEEGLIASDQKDIINNVFELKDSAAKEVMIPRVHVSIISVDSSFDDLLALFREDKYTRYPVYEDTPDRIVGIVNMKDLLLYGDRSRETFSVRDIMRDVRFVFEYKKIGELLAEMKEASASMAVVVDEYGDWSGVISLEDVLEEIVGEIHDEYDEESDELIFEITPHEYLVEGAISLDDLCERLDVSLESEDYDSLGGFILEQLDRIPDAGDELFADGIRMVVESVDKNRIEQVHMWLPEPAPAEDDTESF